MYKLRGGGDRSGAQTLYIYIYNVHVYIYEENYFKELTPQFRRLGESNA